MTLLSVQGTLPMRWLAAEYGCDIVYTEELIDKKIVACTVVQNEALKTTDFVDKSGGVAFRTTPEEKHRLVAQIGTAGAVLALQAAERLAPFVSAVDINMGCPVHFSTSGGMGAALLQKPDTIEDILKTLRRNLPHACGLSCKIRLLPTTETTCDLAGMISRCGVDALAVHGRYVPQRPRDPAHWKEIAAVCSRVHNIPIIANGDVFCYADFQGIRDATGAAAAMCARAAQWNASVFRPDGLLAPADVRAAYARECVRWDNNIGNTKYCLREMLVEDIGLESAEGRALGAVKTNADLARLYHN
jgi:tRNA-dihydrouridine synthase 2